MLEADGSRVLDRCGNSVQQVCEGFGSALRAGDEGEMDENGDTLDLNGLMREDRDCEPKRMSWRQDK